MLHDTLLVFDIETVPDERHHDSDKFPPPAFHEVVAVSFVEAQIDRDGEHETYTFKELRTGGDETYSEAQLLQAFFAYVERKKPRLVTYNGRSFDLPVLKYRAMAHGIAAPTVHHRDYNYRYNLDSHCDLMEALTDFGASTRMKLDDVCAVFGLPGKMGTDGSMVKEMYEAGRVVEIRNYCELDALNTYLVYLRYMLNKGTLTRDAFDKAVAGVVTYLEAERGARNHLGEYLDAWSEATGGNYAQSQR